MAIILLLLIAGCNQKKDSSTESPDNNSDESLLPENLPPRACFGKLTEDKVRIRSLPGLNSEIIGKLTLGEEVQILCRTSEKYTAVGAEDYWYIIKRNNGMVGWAFGYYLDFSEPVDNAVSIHYIDYSNEVKYEDRTWIGEYYVYRLLNEHKLPPGYAGKLHKTGIRITLNDAYEFSIGYHPDINEKEYVHIKTMNQMDGFIIEEYKPVKMEVSFVNNYIAIAGESIQNDQTYKYEIYYAGKKD